MSDIDRRIADAEEIIGALRGGQDAGQLIREYEEDYEVVLPGVILTDEQVRQLDEHLRLLIAKRDALTRQADETSARLVRSAEAKLRSGSIRTI